MGGHLYLAVLKVCMAWEDTSIPSCAYGMYGMGGHLYLAVLKVGMAWEDTST